MLHTEVKGTTHGHRASKDWNHICLTPSARALNHPHASYMQAPCLSDFHHPCKVGNYYHSHEIDEIEYRASVRLGHTPHLPRSPLGSHGSLESVAACIYWDIRAKCLEGKGADNLPRHRWGSRGRVGQKGAIKEKSRGHSDKAVEFCVTYQFQRQHHIHWTM